MDISADDKRRYWQQRPLATSLKDVAAILDSKNKEATSCTLKLALVNKEQLKVKVKKVVQAQGKTSLSFCKSSLGVYFFKRLAQTKSEFFGV